MKKSFPLFAIIALCSSLSAFAYDFQVDGLYYTVSDKTGQLVNLAKGDVKYTGDIVIPSSVSYGGTTYTVSGMESQVCQDCKTLTSVVIGDKITKIPQYAFYGCTNLETVTLGTKVESLGYAAFSGCTNLSSINLNDNITSFDNSVFLNCTSLTSVVLGESILEMGSSVFNGCTNLRTVEIHQGCSVIGSSAFQDCKKLQTIDIPNSVIKIGSQAFQNCVNLTSAKIGNGVQEIPQYTFLGCTRLNTVSLGSGILSVDYSAFYNCSQLNSLTVLNPQTPSVDNTSFNYYNANLYVPVQSLSAYKSHEAWSKFTKTSAIEGQVYLTIRQAETGTIRQAVNTGEYYSFEILPSNGWTIHSVTFNDVDVTKELVAGVYTTPALTVNSTLSVVFEEGNSINSVTSDDVKVTVDSNGDIIVSGASEGSIISVYSIDGKLLNKTTANSFQNTIRMNASGTYIVKVGTLTTKLTL